MRLFWKALLLAAIPIGGYWLYKKGKKKSAEKQEAPSQQVEIGEATSQEQKEEELSTKQIIERLSEIDGVTSRVAENLVEQGIKSREALLQLSEEELKSIKGIGPKRAAKILNL